MPRIVNWVHIISLKTPLWPFTFTVLTEIRHSGTLRISLFLRDSTPKVNISKSQMANKGIHVLTFPSALVTESVLGTCFRGRYFQACSPKLSNHSIFNFKTKPCMRKTGIRWPPFFRITIHQLMSKSQKMYSQKMPENENLKKS